MKNEEGRIKSEKAPTSEDKSVIGKSPEHGADSQLHNYNAVSWRLADMFGDEDEPEPPKPKK